MVRSAGSSRALVPSGRFPTSGWALWSTWHRRVLVVAIVCTALKLLIAARTYGADDVRYWIEFMHGVERHGPIGIYGAGQFEAPYNHPPLVGWALLLASKIAHVGVSAPFLIRLPSSLADLGSTMLLLGLLERRMTERRAGMTALVFAVSPVLFVISGFHGNSDPVFVMLCLLSGYALVVARRGFVAGVAIGLAVSVKVVPVVLVPLLIVIAVRAGNRLWLRFLAGGGLVFACVWAPAMALRGHEVVSQVFQYAGSGPRQWGLSETAQLMQVSYSTTVDVGDELRFLAVGLAAIVPAVLALRGRDQVALLGLPLCLFLFLSPSFGYQYLSWALAPAFLLASLPLASMYSLLSAITVVVVYSHWNHAPPWRWDVALSTPTPADDMPLLYLTWISLGLVCLAPRRIRPGRAETDPRRPARSRSGKEEVGAAV